MRRTAPTCGHMSTVLCVCLRPPRACLCCRSFQLRARTAAKLYEKGSTLVRVAAVLHGTFACLAQGPCVASACCVTPNTHTPLAGGTRLCAVQSVIAGTPVPLNLSYAFPPPPRHIHCQSKQ
jgi:hypothetical protein